MIIYASDYFIMSLSMITSKHLYIEIQALYFLINFILFYIIIGQYIDNF